MKGKANIVCFILVTLLIMGILMPIQHTYAFWTIRDTGYHQGCDDGLDDGPAGHPHATYHYHYNVNANSEYKSGYQSGYYYGYEGVYSQYCPEGKTMACIFAHWDDGHIC